MGEWRNPRRIALAVFGLLVTTYMLAPVLINIPIGLSSATSLSWPPIGVSTRWYVHMIEEPGWRGSILLSALVAAGTAVTALAIGVPMALGLVRGRFPGQRLLAGLVLTPLVVPTIIVAIGMYFVWTRGWSVGPITVGGKLVGSPLGFVLAHVPLAIPYVVILVGASLGTVERDLELAARSLGATPWRAFRSITAPLILPGILAGAILAFLVSWDEAIIAMFLSTPGQITLPVRMFFQARESIDPTVAAVSTVMSAITGTLFMLMLVVRRRTA
jgi:putative spermidine/putrescine transport system permease protein